MCQVSFTHQSHLSVQYLMSLIYKLHRIMKRDLFVLQLIYMFMMFWLISMSKNDLFGDIYGSKKTKQSPCQAEEDLLWDGIQVYFALMFEIFLFLFLLFLREEESLCAGECFQLSVQEAFTWQLSFSFFCSSFQITVCLTVFGSGRK